jgi:hypothetical protein
MGLGYDRHAKTQSTSKTVQKHKTHESKDVAQKPPIEEKIENASERVKADDQTLQHLAQRIDEDEQKT